MAPAKLDRVLLFGFALAVAAMVFAAFLWPLLIGADTGSLALRIVYLLAYLYFGFDRDQAYEKVWVVAHHHYTHGLGFAVIVGILAWLWARAGPNPGRALDAAVNVGLFSCLAVLLHVFFDLIAAGPRFPVYPLWPLSDLPWTVSWSAELKDWPNQIITLSCLGAILAYARLAGRSPLESLSYRLEDAWVVRIARPGAGLCVGCGTRSTGHRAKAASGSSTWLATP